MANRGEQIDRGVHGFRSPRSRIGRSPFETGFGLLQSTGGNVKGVDHHLHTVYIGRRHEKVLPPLSGSNSAQLKRLLGERSLTPDVCNSLPKGLLSMSDEEGCFAPHGGEEIILRLKFTVDGGWAV